MINLLPYKQQRLVTRLRRLRVICMALGFFLIVIVAALLLLLPASLAISNEYAFAQTQLKQYANKGELVPSEESDALIAKVTGLTATFTAPKGVIPFSYIHTLSGATSAEIHLNRIAAAMNTSSTVEVGGIASDRVTLQQFVDRLRATPSVSTVVSPVSNYVKNKNAEFTLTVTFQ